MEVEAIAAGNFNEGSATSTSAVTRGRVTRASFAEAFTIGVAIMLASARSRRSEM